MSNGRKTILMIAGEASGDLLGAELIECSGRQPGGDEVDFIGAGGPRMEAASLRPEFDLSEHAAVGIWEVLKNYFKFRRLFRHLFELATRREPDAIVLIDYIQRLRREGMEPREAIVVAARTRFRPVIMTAITTILGLIPLATGISFDFFSFSWEIGGRSSEWGGPMGIAVVFGLAFATILTLVVVPVMVQLIWRWTEHKRPVAMAAAAD